jgi:ribonucrease Y
MEITMITGAVPLLVTGIIIGASAFIVGGILAYFGYRTLLKKKRLSIIKEAELEAEVIKKEKILQAKEKFYQLKMEHENFINERNQKLNLAESRFKQRETALSQKLGEAQKQKEELDTIKENLNVQLELVEKKSEELEKLHRQQVEKLQQLSGMSGEEAKSQLVESMKEEAKTEAMSMINEIVSEAKMTANKEAKKIVVQSIQRVAAETAIENSVTVFHIDSDEIKGRIIGREGRNIRALEAATGVEIIVDDTPEAIILSAFDPVRREIADLPFINW